MTTPIAYLTTYPMDVFRDVSGVPGPVCYGVCTSGMPYYYVWSLGPDRADNHATLDYDPTNGTVSAGDVIRTTQPGI